MISQSTNQTAPQAIYEQNYQPINLDKQFAHLDVWQPVNWAITKNNAFKLVVIEGDYGWHTHEDDKLLMVLSGTMSIEFDNQASVHLKTGEWYVVPKEVSHKPQSDCRCNILLIERV